MKRKLLLLVLSFLYLITCNAQQTNQTKNLGKMILEYSDGNGNYYKISQELIVYKPITKEMSSSGMYDGGEPITRKIDLHKFEKVVTVFEGIFRNDNIQISNRIKTSGMLTIHASNTDKKTCIIKSSIEQQNLEKLLKSLLSD